MSLQFIPISTPGNFNAPRDSHVRLVSKIHLDRLELQAGQKSAIDQLYSTKVQLFDTRYDENDQDPAKVILATTGIEATMKGDVGHKWSRQWRKAGWKGAIERSLYQCMCGKGKSAQEDTKDKRRIIYPFTSCLAHVEVTISTTTKAILRIQGYLQHNEACQVAMIERMPTTPVHPEVFELAIQQIRAGATLTGIQDRNRQLAEAKLYPAQQKPENLGRFRFVLGPKDTSSLYTQYYQSIGIDIKAKAHENIHNWLDPQSKHYKPSFASSVFHYAPRTDDSNSRLELCIATNEMTQAAWRFGHRKQIMVDGTFGVANCRMLLFVVMAVDENNHGVPLAFFLFSAPGGNKATAAGYDTKILSRLFGKWRDHVDAHRDPSRPQEGFQPLVAITDTDLKERNALLEVFPHIQLLICRFHFAQSVRNHRKLHVRGGPAAKQLTDRLQKFLERLKDTVKWDIAQQMLHQELSELEALTGDPFYAHAARGAVTHVTYLRDYWSTEHLWPCWSKFGFVAAADKLGLTIDQVIPTTNHLERFNGLLKHKYLGRWMRGGRTLRVDILAYNLAGVVPDSIFQRWRVEYDEQQALQRAIALVPGGEQLLARSAGGDAPIRNPVAYLQPDENRDAAAELILQRRAISYPSIESTGLRLTAWSLAAPSNEPREYSIWLGFDSTACCSCPDFQNRGGACKHMRAALYGVRGLREAAHGPDPLLGMPEILLPTDKESALSLRAQYQAAEEASILAPIANAYDTAFPGFLPSAPSSEFGDQSDSDDGKFECRTNEDGGSEHIGSDVGWEGWSDGEDLVDSDTPNSMRLGVGEQAIARGTYEAVKASAAIERLDPLLDHVANDQLTRSQHRAAYVDLLGKMRAMTMRLETLLESTTFSQPHQLTAEPAAERPALSQVHLKRLRAPSPERRQRRKQSHSFH